MRITFSYKTWRDHVLEKFSRDYLHLILTLSGGDVSKASRIAEVDRTTIYRLAEKYCVNIDDYRINHPNQTHTQGH